MLFTAIISLIAYLPVRVIPPPKRCLPFVLIFLGEDQDELAIASTIILSILLIVLLINLLIIGFDTSMLIRTRVHVTGIEPDSGELYVRTQQKKHPHRKVIFYGLGLFLQYVQPSISI